MNSMSSEVKHEVECFMKGLIKRNPGEPEFQQAVQEVVETIAPFILDHKKYKGYHEKYSYAMP